MQKNNKGQCVAALPNMRTPCGIAFIIYQVKPIALKYQFASVHFTNGHQLRKRPIKKMRAVLFNTFFQNKASPPASSFGITKAIALPTANKKNGNTRSVGVNPCQGACSSGA